jgi:hypothetical protein
MRRGRVRFKLCVKASEDLDELSSAQWLELVMVLYDSRAWFRICHFRVTRARGNCRPVRGGSRLKSCSCRKAASLPGSGSPGLKWPEAQQRKPVRMALAGHQFPWAFAGALGAAAAHETTVVQEELQQVQV